MNSYNSEDRRKIIMDYYMNPRRKESSNFDISNFKTYYYHSLNCVDEITLIDLKEDFHYQAQGCAVFLSSVEIFLEEAAKNNFQNMKKLSLNYEKLINQKELTEEEIIFLGKLIIFSNVKKHLNRVECALMITKVLEKIT